MIILSWRQSSLYTVTCQLSILLYYSVSSGVPIEYVTMTITPKTESLLLLMGDIVIFVFALFATLTVRYFEVPQSTLFYNHLIPFSFLFVVWVLVFFISGLYNKHTILFKRKLPSVILSAQAVNIMIAAIFFFFIPYFNIAPKTNLIIYLIISFGLILSWRLLLFPTLGVRKRQKALVIGSGDETKELVEEVNRNTRYSLTFVAFVDLGTIQTFQIVEGVEEAVRNEGVSIIVIDAKDERVVPALPLIYSHVFKGVQFVDMSKLYEDIFDRIPISFVKQQWLIDNVSLPSKPTYDFLKRVFDVSIAFVLGTISLILYPFVILALKLDDGGAIFSIQERIGKNNQRIKLIKFRTMAIADDGGKWNSGIENKVTRVGEFLRKSRVDELPQLWNVLQGSVSLIGPRSEFHNAVSEYEKEIPYYNIRHLIKPGLSGWAQIYGEHPHHGIDVLKTENKLSYDLYYVKNRSFLVDLKIALLTIKTLFSRSGL